MRAYFAYVPRWYRILMPCILLAVAALGVLLAGVGISLSRAESIYPLAGYIALYIMGLTDSHIFYALYAKDSTIVELLKSSASGKRILTDSVHTDICYRLIFCLSLCFLCPLPGYILMRLNGGAQARIAITLLRGLLLALNIWTAGNMLSFLLRHIENMTLIALTIYASTLLLLPAVVLLLQFADTPVMLASALLAVGALGGLFALLHHKRCLSTCLAESFK